MGNTLSVVEENRIRCRQYYIEHREAIRARRLAYYQEAYPRIRETENEKKRLKYRESLEENRKKAKQRYHCLLPVSRVKSRLAYHNSRERKSVLASIRYNKDLAKTHLFQRVQRILRDFGSLTEDLITQVYARNRQRNKGVLVCYLCHKPIEEGQDNLEHKLPLCRGGKNELENLDVAHRLCNRSKGALTYEEFMLRERK
jgi:5-methylcytosine-specific restriction endonuclease McrA